MWSDTLTGPSIDIPDPLSIRLSISVDSTRANTSPESNIVGTLVKLVKSR